MTITSQDAVTLTPTASGYRVYVGKETIGYLMVRVWEPHGRVEDGSCIAAPWAIDQKCERFQTVGTALDYLMSL